VWADGAPVPLHLGTLHPVEQLLVLVLAFGPFAVLGLVVRRQRRREARLEEGLEEGLEEEARPGDPQR
jgi:hypothetical protein